MATPPAPIDPSTVRCPTCRASQAWSDTCRRCKSDLRLLREFAGAFEGARRACLTELREGDSQAARQAARRAFEIAPGAEASRLLALASLRAGDWATASEIVRKFDQD